MAELMRRHVNADVIRKGVSDLLAYGLLAFPPAAVIDEQMTLVVGAEARHYVAAIPSKAASNLIRHFGDKVLSLGLGVPGGNVKD
jgi:hypothetical protein